MYFQLKLSKWTVLGSENFPRVQDPGKLGPENRFPRRKFGQVFPTALQKWTFAGSEVGSRARGLGKSGQENWFSRKKLLVASLNVAGLVRHYLPKFGIFLIAIAHGWTLWGGGIWHFPGSPLFCFSFSKKLGVSGGWKFSVFYVLSSSFGGLSILLKDYVFFFGIFLLEPVVPSAIVCFSQESQPFPSIFFGNLTVLEFPVFSIKCVLNKWG